MKKILFKIRVRKRIISIYTGRGILSKLPDFIGRLKKKYSQIIVITDRNLERFYGREIIKILKSTSLKVSKIVLVPGERTKSIRNVEKILNELMKKNCDRNILIAAFGGGVVGDITGFCASIYKRGVDYIQIPTSLMAMVDSSVGGKTGINSKFGKNLIGSFYQPEFVLADVSLLSTLPEKEYITALSEVVKYGIIRDSEFFRFFKNNVKKIVDRDYKIVEKIVYKSLSVKSDIVEKDEKESNIRAILNLGHTFGHAYEKIFAYRGNPNRLGDQYFWQEIFTGNIKEGDMISLMNFQVSPWVPRKPGLFWTYNAAKARNKAIQYH